MDEERKSPREPWLAVTLSSLVPGLGQSYAGHKLRGALFFLGQAFLAGVAVDALMAPHGDTLLAGVLLLAIVLVGTVCLFDAHRCARRENGLEFESERRRTRDAWAAVFLSRLFPGLGHLFLRKYKASSLFILAALVLTGIRSAWWVDGATAVLAAFAILHAYKAAPVRRSPLRGTVLFIAGFIGGLALLPTVLRTYVVQPYIMPASSMAPTLLAGDRFFVNKFAYGLDFPFTWVRLSARRQPAIGDLILFRSPVDGRDFIKRCVAVAGDTVEMRNKALYRNGEIQKESFVQHTDPTTPREPEEARDFMRAQVVPDGRIFVMGDNRDNSFDSRFWGPLPLQNVKGRAFKIYWPIARAGPVE